MSARADTQVPAVPDDVDDPPTTSRAGSSCCRAQDRSGDPCLYDVSDLRQCARVCEQVLRKGNHDDIRYSINVDQLQQLWTQLWLPRRARAAWTESSASGGIAASPCGADAGVTQGSGGDCRLLVAFA
jgi:hypothetical protein